MVTIEPAADTPEGASCMEYRDGGFCGGRIFYRVTGETAELLRLEIEEAAAADALVRAALNAAELRGARLAQCENRAVFPLLSSLGFVKIDKGMAVSLRVFFDRPCRSRG